ncbi:MAG: DNA photolyase [Deltaproteobacteria bacterium]|nr:DNA photolyase [Deltaproteobacteria bacterium]
MSKKINIKNLLIETGAEQYDQSIRIINRLKSTPNHPITEGAESNVQYIDMDKETLRLIPFQGSLFKPCPGTKEYICCGYQILNVGTNCPFNCSYCILQAYFNQPSLRVFVNLENELPKIARLMDSQPQKIFRVGTGEFTDSLALDHITEWSRILPKFFQDRKNAVLEFKTKTDQIDGMLSNPFRDRMIVSWSLNSMRIAANEENGAPSIKKRLEAAKKCQEEGYVLGFHFDPLIHHARWKEEYARIVELMDQYINPKNIIWMSLGCFRYIPTLKEIIRTRHPNSGILDDEFIIGLDGKQRYFKPVRIEMYTFMHDIIDKWYTNIGLYLCMESHEVWRKSFGWSPRNNEGLAHYLDERVRLLFKG